MPRGVDQYLEQRADALSSQNSSIAKPGTGSSAAEQRQLKKDLARVEKQITKGKERIVNLIAEQEREVANHQRLVEIANELAVAESELASREEEWLAVTLALES